LLCIDSMAAWIALDECPYSGAMRFTEKGDDQI
jgi:hypothetical protein